VVNAAATRAAALLISAGSSQNSYGCAVDDTAGSRERCR
jgi:hypothetical protein